MFICSCNVYCKGSPGKQKGDLSNIFLRLGPTQTRVPSLRSRDVSAINKSGAQPLSNALFKSHHSLRQVF